jgi:hypothetical protein
MKQSILQLQLPNLILKLSKMKPEQQKFQKVKPIMIINNYFKFHTLYTN